MTRRGFEGAGGAAPVFSLWLRCVLVLPLLAAALLFTALGCIGAARLAMPGWPALPGAIGTAAMTALICLVLAVPAAAGRLSVGWVVPLAVTTTGAAAWPLLPLSPGSWRGSLEGAVLLLPVMVGVLGLCWRRIPGTLAGSAVLAGASPASVLLHAVIRPALPGVARGLALVFTLALGLAPLLAPASGNP